LVLLVVFLVFLSSHLVSSFDPMQALQAYGNTYCAPGGGLSWFSTGTEYNDPDGYPCLCQEIEGGNHTWCSYPYECVGYFVTTLTPYYYNIQQSPSPPFVFTEYFDNNSTAGSKIYFSKSESTTNSYSWTLSEGIFIGESLSVTAGLPGVCEVHDQFTFNMYMNETQTQTGSDTQNWDVSEEIGVPPMSTVRVDVIVSTAQTSADFTTQATFDPNSYGNIWCANQVNSHYEWFVPPSFFLDGTFSGAVCNDGACNITGVFTGLQGLSVYVNVTQCPLDDHC